MTAFSDRYPDAWLLTVEELATYLNLSQTDVAEHYDRLVQTVRQASADVIAYLNRLPLPHRVTLEYAAPSSRFLPVGGDLLEVVEFLHVKGTALAADEYRLQPFNVYPKAYVELTRRGCDSYQTWCGSRFATVQLQALMGYAPHWLYAFESVGQLAAELSASTTTLVLTDVSAIGTGQTLRMGSEYLFVSAVERDAAPATSGTLTLKRGVLGSTKAVHALGATIERFRVLDAIHSSAIEWAAYLEKSRDSVGKRVQVSEQGLLVVNDLSPLVKQTLDRHVFNPAVQIA